MDNGQLIDNHEGDLDDLVTYLISLKNHKPRSVILDIDAENMSVSNLFHFLLDLLVSIVRKLWNIELFSITDTDIKNIDTEIEETIKKYYSSMGFQINLIKIAKDTFNNYLENLRCDYLPDLTEEKLITCREDDKLKDHTLNIDIGNEYLKINFNFMCY